MHASNINQNKFQSASHRHARLRLKSAEFFRLLRTASAATTETFMPRTNALHRYAIRGGKEGKKRLDVLVRVLQPTTKQFLDRVGAR